MKVVVDIPEVPKNDKQRWALENGTPYVDRPHGEWVLDKEISFVFNIYECSKCRFNGSKRWHFCPNCGASMQKEGEQKCGE